METYPAVPLDPPTYHLDEDQLAFFKSQTGIQDEHELRNHILEVQAEAYAVYPYPCIWRLTFTHFKISRYTAYDAVLRLGRERQGALLLDLGCCFGNDARKVVSDGFPRENVIASDLHPEFWALGHRLFKTSPETFPMCFLPGDIFDPSFLSPDAYPAPSSSSPPGPPHPLAKLTSLTQIQHHLSVIHTGAFFHLFSETKQSELAHLLATLLSPLPGSIILGSHQGQPDTEYKADGGLRVAVNGTRIFAHSPTSWNNLWVGSGGVFKPEDVITRAEATEVERKFIGDTDSHLKYGKSFILEWSVTRV
ncbi:hypothetical protein JB92DRAFT_3090780 [Gautieria morchelliformis]|nr:hypothetical protein JB92DRAFT_3090780 [Gautieria morchelliformis]